MSFFKNTGSGTDVVIKSIKDWLYEYSNIKSDDEFEIIYSEEHKDFIINTFINNLGIVYNDGTHLPYKFEYSETFCIESDTLEDMSNFPIHINGYSSFGLTNIRNLYGFPKYINNSVELYNLDSLNNFSTDNPFQVNGTITMYCVDNLMTNNRLFESDYFSNEFERCSCDKLIIETTLYSDFYYQMVRNEISIKDNLNYKDIEIGVIGGKFNIKYK